MTATPQRAAGHCHGCATYFEFDPETAASVLFDLAMQRPVPADRKLAAGEERPASWRKLPVCDDCADKAEAEARTLGLFPLWPLREVQKVSQ